MGKVIDPAGDLGNPFLGQAQNYRTRAQIPTIWYPMALGAPERTEAFLKLSCECLAHGGIFCLASLIQNWLGPGVSNPSFPAFTQSTLAVWGMNDRSHRRSDKRSLLNIAPHARYIEREGAGHFPQIEDPAWFETLLKDSLRDGG